MKGICNLFDNECDLRESHIFPKFVIEYMKETGSRFLRNLVNPNQRFQDGPKMFLLSEKAEQEFSKREKKFAENIFLPYLEKEQKEFYYNDYLFYFSISMLWRVLQTHKEHPNIINQPFYGLLKDVENNWKQFLKNYTYPKDYDKIHLFFTDRVLEHNCDVKGADYYFTRALDATIISNENNTFVAVYCKFMRFVIFSVITDYEDKETSDTIINPLGGRFVIPQNFNNEYIGSFFINRMKEIENAQKPSEKQQDKVLEEIRKDKERFFNSDAGKSMINDIKLDENKTDNRVDGW